MTFAAEAQGALVRPSPNHGERRKGPIDILLLHYTGMPTAEEALDWLCDPRSGVSCHYVVLEDGRVLQLVPEARRAWHAGASFWAGETDVNSRSIGVEIVNPGHDHGYRPFPDAQIEALIRLGREIAARHGIRPARVLAHSDVAPARKRDPGELFPWRRLAAAGLGLFVAPAPPAPGPALARGHCGDAVAVLKRDLARWGYGVSVSDVFDEATAQVVAAFQRHYRPSRIDGAADPSVIATLRRLLSVAF